LNSDLLPRVYNLPDRRRNQLGGLAAGLVGTRRRRSDWRSQKLEGNNERHRK
jgi:hypothetical protein